jgi:anti-sigma B factor antagonist
VEFEEQQHGEVTVLKILGQLDALTEDQMFAKIEDLVLRNKTRLVIDIFKLEFVDSAGIGALVSLFKRMRLLKGDAKILGLGGQPREIFKLLRLDKAFECFDALDKALASKWPS